MEIKAGLRIDPTVNNYIKEIDKIAKAYSIYEKRMGKGWVPPNLEFVREIFLEQTERQKERYRQLRIERKLKNIEEYKQKKHLQELYALLDEMHREEKRKNKQRKEEELEEERLDQERLEQLEKEEQIRDAELEDCHPVLDTGSHEMQDQVRGDIEEEKPPEPPPPPRPLHYWHPRRVMQRKQESQARMWEAYDSWLGP